ncbi:MAG TPA: hypothetical protein VFP15_10355 [Gemmatimonadaceae bacterium]|nr:hypothetical protein [Gemmatimonadaceae bacterium]
MRAGEPHDPLERLREQRLHEIMTGLVPRLRPLFPDMPDDLFQELIERMAELQARDEQQDWGEL